MCEGNIYIYIHIYIHTHTHTYFLDSKKHQDKGTRYHCSVRKPEMTNLQEGTSHDTR